mgnify:CR=1 FL=1
MKLPPARYTIVAIAGLGEEYIVPKDPSLDDVIVMKENNRSSRALMMGTSTVTIANKKNISVSCNPLLCCIFSQYQFGRYTGKR